MLNMSTHIYLVIYYLYQVSYVFSRWWIVDGRNPGNPVILVMLIMVYRTTVCTSIMMIQYDIYYIWWLYSVIAIIIWQRGNNKEVSQLAIAL